jgi:hypothetical protein
MTQRIIQTLVRLIVFGVAAFALAHVVYAQPTGTPVSCGDVVEAETTPDDPIQNFILQVRAGTVLNGRVEPIGSTFNPFIVFLDSGNSQFAQFNEQAAGLAEEVIDFAVSSSNPILQVAGVIPQQGPGYFAGQYDRGTYGNYFGAYTIYLGCTLRDGTIIQPGQNTSAVADDGTDTEAAAEFAEATVALAAPAFGFAGLAPVDFANVARLPIPAGVPMSGAVTPNGGEILGYTLSGNEGETVSLSFTRLSGNLNLGLVVLSENNDLVFQASLVNTDAMTAQFKLPATGNYIAGVFRIDLLPPAAPEATAFQVGVEIMQ